MLYDRDDNVYSGSGGLFSGAVKTGLAGGAMYVGARLILDKNAFENAFDTVKDWTTEVNKPDLSAYHNDLSNIRSSVLRGTKIANNIYKPNKKLIASAARLENIIPADQIKQFDNTQNISKSLVQKFGIGYDSLASVGINDWSEVADINGQSIGHKIKARLSDLGYDTDNVRWNGTQATVSDKSGKEFSIAFEAATNKGHTITRVGTAHKVTAPFYQIGKDQKSINLLSYNEMILNNLSDLDVAKNTIEASVTTPDIIKHLSMSDAYRLANTRADLITAMEQQHQNKLYQIAVKEIEKRAQFNAPTNTMALEMNSNIINADAGYLHGLEKHDPVNMTGIWQNKINVAPITIGTNNLSGRNIMKRYGIPISATLDDIMVDNMSVSSLLNSNQQKLSPRLRRIVSAISDGGITSSVSAGQVPDGTFFMGGNIWGPGNVEKFKSQSQFGLVKALQEEGVSAWRYGSRYSANGSGGRILNTMSNINGGVQGRFYLDPLAEERILVKNSRSRILKTTAPISANFEAVTEDVLNQKLTVAPVSTIEKLRTLPKGSAKKKQLQATVNRDFAVADLYGIGPKSEELATLMLSQDEHRIYGLNRGFKVGVVTDARPYTEEAFGTELISNYRTLKQQGYMGSAEYNHWIASVANHADGGKYSLPIVMTSQGTKAAIHGTKSRANIVYADPRGNVHSPDGQLQHIIAAATNKREQQEVMGLISADLYKSAIPKANTSLGGIVGGKQSDDLMIFLHDMIYGHVDVADSKNRTIILEGKALNAFKTITGNDFSGNAQLNLNSFMHNGGTIAIESSNQAKYAEQLAASLDLAGTIRDEYIQGNLTHDLKGIVTIDNIDNGRELLDKHWSSWTAAWEDIKLDGSSHFKKYTNMKNVADNLLWPIMPTITAMENKELAQGSGRLNKAKIAMREQLMFMGSRSKILGELLSRSSNNTMQHIKEAELLKTGLGGELGQSEMLAKTNEYANFIGQVYGPEAKKEYMSLLDVAGTPKDVKDIANKKTGINGLTLSQARGEAALMQDSFLNPEKNRFGYALPVEGGGIMHLPSGEALGAFTLLKEQGVTFEGKTGANVGVFWKMAEDLRSHGYVKQDSIRGFGASIMSAAKFIEKDRAAIQVDDAMYSRVIQDTNITDHGVMGKLKDSLSSFSNDSDAIRSAKNLHNRSVLGNVVTYSYNDMHTLIEEQLKTMLGKAGSERLTVSDLSKLHETWIHEDHGDILKNGAKKLVRKRVKPVLNPISLQVDPTKEQLTLSEIAKKITQKKYKSSLQLKGKLDKLYSVFSDKKMSADERLQRLTNDLDDIARFIRKHGVASVVQRNPTIFSSSLSAASGFINLDSVSSVKVQGKGKKGGKTIYRPKHDTDKMISGSFDIITNLKADWDGDKIQAMILYNMSTKKAAFESITGIQAKSAKYMSDVSKRLKLSIGKDVQTFSLTNDNLTGITDLIFKGDKTSAYAAFMTKAMTGSMNISAFAAKALIERNLASNTKVNPEQLEEIIAFTRSITSLATEQQVISSKQIESLIKGSVPGKTMAESIMESIGSTTPEKLKEMLKESSGQMHPLMMFSVANMKRKQGSTAAMDEIYEIINTHLNLQTGWGRVEEAQLDKYRDVFGHKMSDSEWVIWKQQVADIQKTTPVVGEMESFRAAGLHDKSLLDIFAESFSGKGDSIHTIMKEAEDVMKESYGAEFDPLKPEYAEEFASEIYAASSKRFNAAAEVYGSELSSMIPKEIRALKGTGWLKENVGPAIDWIKEAPMRRLGGIGIAALGLLAGYNLIFGDSTPTSVNDIPSMSQNPLMDAKGGFFGTGNAAYGNHNSNVSVGLLSRRSVPHLDVAGSINSSIGARGHSISVRSDISDPYYEKMSQYR